MMLWQLLSQQQYMAENPATWGSGSLALLAVALMIIALLFIILEFFIISGGALTAIAVILGILAIGTSFRAHPLMGWAMLVAMPLLATWSIRMGLRRMLRSSLVTQATISEDAGYHHRARQIGVEVGSEGCMVTAAMPTGRCRFAGGELDVCLQQGSARAGQSVRVIRLDGASIYVIAIESQADTMVDATGDNGSSEPGH